MNNEQPKKVLKASRKSTIVRNNQVHSIYNDLKNQYGDKIFNSLSKAFIYEEISIRTGLCAKTISNILNHSNETQAPKR